MATSPAHLFIEPLNGPLSAACAENGIFSMLSLMEWVEQLPYARNSNRANYRLVIDEGIGTCSTKHAFVKAVALENGFEVIRLYIGVFLMSDQTHPGVGEILDKHQLKNIPEAHTFLEVNGQVTDITGLKTGAESFQDSLQKKMEIQPDDIGTVKETFHKAYLNEVAAIYGMDAGELWRVREACILKLSN